MGKEIKFKVPSLTLGIDDGNVIFSGVIYTDGTSDIYRIFNGFSGGDPIGHYNVKKGYTIMGAKIAEAKKKLFPKSQTSFF